MDSKPTYTYSADNCDIGLYQSDCIDGMNRLVEAGSVDVVVTSPPYNLGIAYGSYDDTVPRSQYLDWIDTWGIAVRAALSHDGSLFLNIGGKPSDPWGPFDVLRRLRQHFVLQNTIHWVKSIAIDGDDVDANSGVSHSIAVGHYKPINSKRFINDCHEYIFHLTKSGDVALDQLALGVESQDNTDVARRKAAGGDLRCRGNTWFVPYETIRNRDKQRPHPATFPIKLPLMCIRLHGTERVRRVMDPFLGLGHSALACKILKVPFIGFEIDESYFSEACRLVETFDPSSLDRKRSNQMSLFDA
jgi:site-specific DNA-methyltransferase (adenine-specific)